VASIQLATDHVLHACRNSRCLLLLLLPAYRRPWRVACAHRAAELLITCDGDSWEVLSCDTTAVSVSHDELMRPPAFLAFVHSWLSMAVPRTARAVRLFNIKLMKCAQRRSSIHRSQLEGHVSPRMKTTSAHTGLIQMLRIRPGRLIAVKHRDPFQLIYPFEKHYAIFLG
jgi:hypothetical protein